jgi:hypothetical protein
MDKEFISKNFVEIQCDKINYIISMILRAFPDKNKDLIKQKAEDLIHTIKE